MPNTLTWLLRLAANGRLASVEQNSDADIKSCVNCILSYPEGWRDDNPEFGRAELTFKQGGVSPTEIATAITDVEERVTPAIVAGDLDEMGVQRVSVNTGAEGG